MCQRIVFTFPFSLILSFAWSGVPSIVTVDNAFPEAGQTVTFSLNTLDYICISNTAYIVPADGSFCLSIAINGTATYTYSVPGNNPVNLNCEIAAGENKRSNK